MSRSGSIHLAKEALAAYGGKIKTEATDAHGLLQADECGLNAMHLACSHGHLEMAQWLHSELGMSLQVPAIDGQTQLHLAAHRGHQPVNANATR